MKFLVDAQLPKALCKLLSTAGHDCIHTLELPNKNKTSDEEINRLSKQEERIVISKDADFYNSFLQKLEPYKLIYVTTGNITTGELLRLFENNLSTIVDGISRYDLIAINNKSIITIL